jgi:hypothetical protein
VRKADLRPAPVSRYVLAQAKACGVGLAAPGAVCSVACLEWEMRIGESLECTMAIVAFKSALEIFFAKEAKRRFDCCGKHLGCLKCALHAWKVCKHTFFGC